MSFEAAATVKSSDVRESGTARDCACNKRLGRVSHQKLYLKACITTDTCKIEQQIIHNLERRLKSDLFEFGSDLRACSAGFLKSHVSSATG
jgi:hypothetical protein